MKMNKRVLSLLLAVVMVLGAFTTVFAAEDKVEEVKKVQGIENKIQYLVDFKHVEGYEDGKLKLDQHINRAEITKLIVHAEGYKELAERLQGVMKLYTDVDTSHWANGVISVGTTKNTKANNLEMLNGYPNGTFKPAQDVTYAELAKMLVVLVKEDLTKAMHDRANTPQRWAGDWMLWAEELGILEDVKVENSNAAATRRDAFVMMYNAMYKMKFVDRVPANETMGIVSGFNNDTKKLTLNQGDFKKEFNLKADTVYVRYDRGQDRVYKLENYFEDIYKYSFGSLVRVLADDKGNVTHIVELGNDRQGAINKVNWTDVAEKITDGLVKAEIDGKVLKVDGANWTLTNATRYFIADPSKGRLSEVTKADAKEYGVQDAKVAYVGYDVLKSRKGLAEENEAKVIVFTKAKKDADTGQNLRVVRQTNNLYNLELEDTKGKTVNFDTKGNPALFPFIDAVEKKFDGYNLTEVAGRKLQKYDVVNVKDTMIDGSRVVVAIRHTDTDTFPIVKVTKVEGRDIKVQAANEKYTAWIRMTADADQFLETQDLEGKNIQFRLVKGGKNVADIVSIVDAAPKGKITNLVYTNEDLQKGIVTKINKDTIEIRDIDGYKEVKVYEHDLTAQEIEALVVGAEVEFLVRPGNNYDFLAYNFKLTEKQQPLRDELQTKIDEAKALIAGKTIADGSAEKTLQTAITNAETARDKKDNTVAELKEANVTLQTAITAYEDALAGAKAELQTKIDEAKALIAGKTIADGSAEKTLQTAITNAETARDKKDNTVAELKAANDKLQKAITAYNEATKTVQS